MPRKYFRKHLPTHESLQKYKWFARFGGFLQHPNLWHLNRRSVSGGFAIGLFAGLVPGPLQMLTAALIALPLRVNLPVALITTLYTNPFTIGPLYLLAYEYGRLLTGADGLQLSEAPPIDWLHLWASTLAFWHWMSSLGKPLLVGLAALSLTLALLGWVAVRIAWRFEVTRTWRRRKRLRALP